MQNVKIKLTQDQVAIVDSSDYEYLSQFKWYANQYKPGKWRARRYHKGKYIYMHRDLLKTDMLIDHINRDGLDNRRSNLRVVDKQRNSANSDTKSKTGYKGVEYTYGKYRAYIRTSHTKFHIGSFEHAVDAAKAYNEVALEWFGPFANVNKCED